MKMKNKILGLKSLVEYFGNNIWKNKNNENGFITSIWNRERITCFPNHVFKKNMK